MPVRSERKPAKLLDRLFGAQPRWAAGVCVGGRSSDSVRMCAVGWAVTTTLMGAMKADHATRTATIKPTNNNTRAVAGPICTTTTVTTTTTTITVTTIAIATATTTTNASPRPFSARAPGTYVVFWRATRRRPAAS